MIKRILLFIALLLCACVGAVAQGTSTYPASLDSPASLPQATDLKFTYLTAAVNNSATSLTVHSTASYPTTVVLMIDSEYLSCTVGTSTTFTSCTRGFNGSTAAAHSANASVRLPLSAPYINGTRGAALALEAKVGITGTGGTATPTNAGDVLTVTATGATMYKPLPASGSGTVTSVAMTVPGVIFQTPVSGSPITSSGTFALSLNTQTANAVFAGPSSGAAATPTFRSLVANDIPSLDAAKITTGTFADARISSAATWNAKQDGDSDLTAVAGLSSTGLVARTGSGTAAARTITGTANRVTATNGDGVSGNPTLDIGSDVATLSGTQTFTGTKSFDAIQSKVGGTSSYAKGGGVLFGSTSAVVNSGTSETDVVSYSVAANTLNSSFESIAFKVFGTYNTNANGKTIRVKYGSTTFFDSGSLTTNGGTWTLDCTLMRGGSATAQYIGCTFLRDGAAVIVQNTLGSEAMTSTLTLKVTGQGAASSDISMKWYKGSYVPAP